MCESTHCAHLIKDIRVWITKPLFLSTLTYIPAKEIFQGNCRGDTNME